MSERFALYYAPSTKSLLWERAQIWLGAESDGTDGPVLSAGERLPLVRSARRYGFHATIKAPMALRAGQSRDSLMDAVDRFAAVTAPGAVLPIAQALAVELGCEPVVVAERDRPAYAEAIATATTFSRAVVQQATGLLADIGVERPGSFLSALVRSAVDQALSEHGQAESGEDPR